MSWIVIYPSVIVDKNFLAAPENGRLYALASGGNGAHLKKTPRGAEKKCSNIMSKNLLNGLAAMFLRPLPFKSQELPKFPKAQSAKTKQKP
jgi:hypothetical protein